MLRLALALALALKQRCDDADDADDDDDDADAGVLGNATLRYTVLRFAKLGSSLMCGAAPGCASKLLYDSSMLYNVSAGARPSHLRNDRIRVRHQHADSTVGVALHHVKINGIVLSRGRQGRAGRETGQMRADVCT